MKKRGLGIWERKEANARQGSGKRQRGRVRKWKQRASVEGRGKGSIGGDVGEGGGLGG